MSNVTSGLKALGLSFLAVLGPMAFMAAGAQAGWLYLLPNGTLDELTGGTELVKVEKHSDVTLLIAGLNVKILCNRLEGEDFLLQPGNATTAEATGKVAFSECVTIEVSTGLERKQCNPIEQPIKAAFKAHVVLHEGKNYVLFEPSTGLNGIFTTIKFNEELCALIETTDLTGQFVTECGQLNGSGVFIGEDCKNHKVAHLLQQASASLFSSDVLKFGEHVMALDGIAKVELAGPPQGLAWSGEV